MKTDLATCPRHVLAVMIALAAAPALAGAPTCPVTETCKHSNDNCQPTEGLVVLEMLEADPVLKVAVTLNDAPAVETIAVQDPKYTTLMAMIDGTEHQFRLQPDGTFNYLITTPDPDAPGGHDQTLYRGQCLEG